MIGLKCGSSKAIAAPAVIALKIKVIDNNK
jgi:hypothetical protein